MFGRRGNKSRTRIEPRLDWRDAAGDDLRADPADRPPSAARESPPRARHELQAQAATVLFGDFVYWTFVLGVWGAIALAGLVAYDASQLPPIDQLAVPKRPPNIAILADDGSLIANRGDTGGAAVRLIDLPPYLPKAFVAIEDRRFYDHFGIDPVGISRAVVRDVTGGGGIEGGSTLTQQLAKNLFLTQERTLSRKIQEAILALWLERRYSKDQILELYLNRVYFGSGAYGVEAASQKYFGKSARFVTLSEAALLAGLMKSPTKLAPNHNLAGANERAAQVITAMAEQGHITEAMAKMALANPAKVWRDKSAGSINYAADYVMDALDDTVGAIDEDIVVTTTIDLEDAVRGRARADRRTQRQGREVRRRPGRSRRGRSDRRGQGDDRRAQLCRQPVQSRGRGEAPAGLVVQAVRLSGGAGEGPHPGHGARRRADLGQGLESGELQPGIFRPRHADEGACRCRSTRLRCGSASRSGRRRSSRSPTDSASPPNSTRSHRSRSARRKSRRSKWSPPTPPSPTAGSACSRM